MVMFSPQDLEVRIAARRDDLLREASAERLAREVVRSGPGVRSRLAAVLYGLADRLDTECRREVREVGSFASSG
jgi:hypothetical protein